MATRAYGTTAVPAAADPAIAGASQTARAGRREAILVAALACFIEQGYAATSMADVRERSGASIGSIYHHFGGKLEIAATLYVEALRGYQEEAAAAVNGAGAEEGVRALVRHHLSWVAANPRRAGFLLGSRPAEVAEATRDPLRRLNRRFFRAVSGWLEPHVEAGRIRRLPFDVQHAVLLGPSQELARTWLAGRAETDLEAAAAALADAAWNAMRGDTP